MQKSNYCFLINGAKQVSEHPIDLTNENTPFEN